MGLANTLTVDRVSIPSAPRNLDHVLAHSPKRWALIENRETTPLSLTWVQMDDTLMKGEELFRNQLLATKFFVPVASHALIPRPRLAALLDTATKRPLTLISAPAGAGKSTLLSQWVRELPEEVFRVAWLSLDKEENDPVRFWTYLLTALGRMQPGAFSDLLVLLRTRPNFSLSYLPTVLINRLAQSEEQVLLVLDDFHIIVDQTIQGALATLLERLPPQVHVILSTRVDPPLPLSRMRARSQLLEVRAEQLRCTSNEVEDFFREVIGVELEHLQVQQMLNWSEGWLAGLQILGLSLHRYTDSFRLREEVSGSNLHILDYLREEVLLRQSPAVQHFLLHTSLLERFTAPLCDAVLGQRDSQQMLDEIKHANLFLISLDNQRRWYRYHALFAEALRSLLERSDPQAIALVHRRASAWFAGKGYTSEAVQHAIQARDWSQAADLIEAEMLLPLERRCEETTVRKWIEQLPPEVVRTRPHLCLAPAQPRSVPSPTAYERPEPAAVEPPAVPAIGTDNPVRANRPLRRSAPQQDLLDPLSLRELEVLHLMVQGATNAEIALTLVLAVETIKRHVSNILSKLGVANRTQAAVRAHNLGLLCEHQ